MLSSRIPSVGLPRTYLMRAADALASATATYAIQLLVLVTTGSTALTGLAFLLEWSPRLAATAHDQLVSLAEGLTLAVTP
jgi:hypothetical protein